MAAANGKTTGMVPNLTVLETSRSIIRTLLPDEAPWGLNSSSKKCPTPSELPVSSRRQKSVGDDLDYGSQWTSRLSWGLGFILVSLMVLMILGTHPLSDGWTTFSSSCSLSANKEDIVVESASSIESNENLLGEVADDNCWSRSRLPLYFSEERRTPPSPFLVLALDEYTSMHARCTAGKNWETFFTNLTAGFGEEDSCKYLMVREGTEGLGNRFMSIVSAFAYALATDRVLLLDSRRSIDGLLCEPFQGSSWMLPKTFPYDMADALVSVGNTTLNEELEELPAVKTELRHIQTDRDSEFFCNGVQEHLAKVPWIAWRSNQYYMPKLMAVPLIWNRLSPLFGDPGRIFTHLSRFLLLPHNVVWEKTERIYHSYLSTSEKLVGIQLRSPLNITFDQRIFDRMMQCATEGNILPKVSDLPPRPFNNVRNMKPYGVSGTSVFVTSLERLYYEKLLDAYVGKGAIDESRVSVHTMSAEVFENHSFGQSVKAFVDMLLLSFSDRLLTSGASTFGYFSQGFGEIVPQILGTNLERPPLCDVGQSFEPCTHWPGWHDCPEASKNNLTAEHAEWIQKHIRPCQDETYGQQLVSN